MDVLSSTFRLKSFLNVTGLLNATSSEIEGPIFFLHSDDNFRCVPRPWDFFHPVTSYSSGCSGTPRVGDAWLVGVGKRAPHGFRWPLFGLSSWLAG